MNANVRWYVQPRTRLVAQRIADAIDAGGDAFLFNGSLKVLMLDKSRKTVPLWEVSRVIINALRTDADTAGKFTVFSQENNGEIREFDMVKARRMAVARRLQLAKLKAPQIH